MSKEIDSMVDAIIARAGSTIDRIIAERDEARAAMITNDETCQTWERLCAEKDAEVERLQAVARAANGAFLAFAKAPELADDHELMQAMSTLGATLDSYDTLRESWSR